MQEIINFSKILRENNIPVSIRSTQSAYETYELFKDDINDLNNALAAVYIKDKNHRSKFDKIFKSTFGDGNGESEGDKVSSDGAKSKKSKRFLKAYNYNFKIQEPKIDTKIKESDIT